jgi:hypothetical protein
MTESLMPAFCHVDRREGDGECGGCEMESELEAEWEGRRICKV